MHREMLAAAVVMAIVAGCASDRSAPPHLPPLEPDTPKRYECRRAPAVMHIDGALTDGEWAAAPWSDAFVDIEGAQRPPPRFETRMKMLWDDQYLYVAAWMQEPHVWATLTQRDAIVFQDNDFEIFIDPNGDTRQYNEIEVNALGTIFDLFLPRTYIDGGPAHHEWNMHGMQWAVHVDGSLNDPGDRDHGWSVEFALPWEAFRKTAGTRCPPRDGDMWRMNFSRVQWQTEVVDGAYRRIEGTKEDNWVWTPQGVVDMHRPQRWGFVRFTADGAELRP